jgi:hypothetical protein
MMRLYDEEMVYFIGSEEPEPKTTFGISATLKFAGAEWHFIEARPHDMGVCPVVRFRDRMLLEGDEQFGIIEPLIDIQKRIDETTFGLLVAQFYAAFKQRYVIGWVPESEAEQLKATASEFWTFKDSDVKVGQFDETDLTRYLKSKDSALGDMAAIAQVPAQSLGVNGISNISAETLAALEAGKERESDEIATSFGESWKQVIRLGASAHGDTQAATDMSSLAELEEHHRPVAGAGHGRADEVGHLAGREREGRPAVDPRLDRPARGRERAPGSVRCGGC